MSEAASIGSIEQERAKKMNSAFEQYEHHGKTVWVRSNLKGAHRVHCLCYSCEGFLPGNSLNCMLAQTLYQLCVDFNVVTPVWECPQFMEKVDAQED